MCQRETLVFKNATIITPMRVIDNGVLIVENGKISRIGPESETKVPQGIKVIDVADDYLASGFIDIHLHGGGGADAMDGTEEAIEKISKVHAKGGSASIGHSNAIYDEVVSAIEAGFTHVTHMFSGMSGLRRINLFRVAGVIESTLLLDELTTEMIADGKHIPASLMKLVIKAKGLDEVCLVTDASPLTGMSEGQYRMGGLKIIVEDGVANLTSAFSQKNVVFMVVCEFVQSLYLEYAIFL